MAPRVRYYPIQPVAASGLARGSRSVRIYARSARGAAWPE